MYKQFIVRYSAEYEVWAKSKAEAIAKAIEQHSNNPEGDFDAEKIDIASA